LDHLVSAAREGEPTWDDARSDRVLSSALDRRERRATRNRLMRRALVVGSAAAMMGFVFLRGASASSPATTEAQPAATIAAAETFGDAGYARD
jgi:hypothetical protein